MRLLDTIRARFAPPPRPQLYLAAFGKHPGWNDHLDDLGLDTEALLAAKLFIYNQGIGGVIDSGQWDAYGEHALAEFDHLFQWSSGDDLLIGRMWASSDGKGRMRYPMILCAHLSAPPGDGWLPRMSGQLAAWEAACKATTDAREVQRIVAEGRQTAAELLARPTENSPMISRANVAENLGLTAGDEATARILYAIESYLSPYAGTNGEVTRLGLNLKLTQSRLVPQHLRLRSDPAAVEASISFWQQLLADYLAPAAPVLFLAPVGQPYLDVIFGHPTAKQLVCLKAKPAVLPLSCDIPFNLDPEFRAKATTTIQAFLAKSAN